MKYTFFLLFSFTTILFAEAQTGVTNSQTNSIKIESRLKGLNDQLKTFQQESKKQKSVLDSLAKENLMLKAHQDGYSNNITVLTSAYGAILTIGLAVVGFIIPYFQNRKFNSLILDAKKEFGESISKAESKIHLLEKNIKAETKELRLITYKNTIESTRLLMYSAFQTHPNDDAYILWALHMHNAISIHKRYGGNLQNERYYHLPVQFINTALKKPITEFSSFKEVTGSFDVVINEEMDIEWKEGFIKFKEDYNKLYYCSLSKNKEDTIQQVTPS